MSIPAPTRICVCGRKKVDCLCWSAGAGDEALALRDGFDKDQLALMDYVRAVLGHGIAPIPTLLGAMRIELASEHIGFWGRLRVAWRLLVGRRE